MKGEVEKRHYDNNIVIMLFFHLALQMHALLTGQCRKLIGCGVHLVWFGPLGQSQNDWVNI